MTIQRSHYVPAGCRWLYKAEQNSPQALWDSERFREWSFVETNDEAAFTNGADPSTPSAPRLETELTAMLLRATGIASLHRLFRARWILLEAKVIAADCHGICLWRVHILPDDVHRRLVDRSDSKLRADRQALLRNLDYSTEAWTGKVASFTPDNYLVRKVDNISSNEEMSLLKLFNNIPSPNPDPSQVTDPYEQDAMCDILGNKVAGLNTTLYPYQTRSAALMLQKESQPGTVVDPRLIRLRDHASSDWYLDLVSGTVLREPRYYDGVTGGILAEEMGSGKTVICLALILATKGLNTLTPEFYGTPDAPVRPRVGSLAEMAASAATRKGRPWQPWIEMRRQNGFAHENYQRTFENNPGYYFVPAPEPRRSGRHSNWAQSAQEPKKICLSAASLIVVPNNLVAQWRQEIDKHTTGLHLLTVTKKGDEIPTLDALIKCDILLFSQARFESIAKQFEGIEETPLGSVHFKRCIVDEGHVLGNSKINSKSNLLLGLDALRFASRWIVTGTPSRGLFGVNGSKSELPEISMEQLPLELDGSVNEISPEMEKEDLNRIGTIAALYLKARPWANTTADTSDTVADWATYLMLPKHNSKSRGRRDCLESTLGSLIIRHKLSEVGDLLPPVDEKIVVLEGSYQDRLSLNLFSMMIIFNSVQSQRTDMDYFFHAKQRKSLLQIVHNLKQSSFFGGSFFTSEEIANSVKTAEKFLEEKKVPISAEDEVLLRSAIALGHLATKNKLRNLSNQYHELPVAVAGFPGRAGQSWSMDDSGSDVVASSSSLLLSLQKLIYNAASEPEELNMLLNGGLVQAGLAEREKILITSTATTTTEANGGKSQTLAGNTKLGDDVHHKSRSHGVNGVKQKKELSAESFSGPLELTKITSTVSAKLSYLIDRILEHQYNEKIIVFYENDNVAWYLAGMLDVLQVQHLIYAKGLTAERRAQYVDTFHHNSTFRVLLMDLSQAAFGLDMKDASRIYFINPVLNPQVEAQAIGRVRRISQQKPVSVETLVLRNSIDEIILERKQHMTQAEHRRSKSIIDIKPIYEWIRQASVTEMPSSSQEAEAQMTPLREPQKVFGRGFGRTLHPDEGLYVEESNSPIRETTVEESNSPIRETTVVTMNGVKRNHEAGPGAVEAEAGGSNQREESSSPVLYDEKPPARRRVRFAGA